MNLEGQYLGEFEILERLGQGGMGAVYKARQTSLERFVALKTLQASLAEDAEYIARFRQEAKAAAVLNHPNLVQVYSAGVSEGLHWFAMEYVEGESAQARVKRKGRLDSLEAIAIAIHVATALEYGWRKAALIHRDIKPDNIFLSEDGEVKLGDLGLAKSAGQTQGLTVTGASMGTPHYISPEQAQAMKTVDFRADIYSLGCTLYHLLSGQPPYTGDSAVAVMMKHVSSPVPNLRGVWPECPPELAAVVMKMMLKPPEARPQSYEEVNAELRRVYDLLSGNSVPEVIAVTQMAGVRRTAVAVKKKRGVPSVAWVGGGLALLAGIAALFHFAPSNRGGQLVETGRTEKERPFPGTAPDGPESGFIPLFGANGISDWRRSSAGKWDFGGGVLSCRMTTKSTARLWCPKDFAPADFELRFSVRGDRGPAFEFRQDADNVADHCYRFEPTALEGKNTVFWGGKAGALAKAGQRVRVTRDDQPEELSKLATLPKWKNGDWNAVALAVQGNHFSCTCNGLLVAEVTDESSSYRAGPGEFGFRVTNNADGELEAEFKDIHIQRLPAALPAQGASTPAAATKDKPFVNSLGMKFVPVPIVSGPSAGQQVLFGVWDVRVQDYAAYAGANNVDDAWTKQNIDGVPVGRESSHPAVGMSWNDAQEFCQWLTKKETAEGKLPKGLKYRLPTDEEWSRAAAMPPEGGGTPAEKSGKNSVDFPWGKDYPPTKKVGNYADEAFHRKFPKPDAKDPKVTNQWIAGYDDGYATTSPVGSFPANAYGLCDMGGNVWQWCEDWYDASQKDRVLRGASWYNYDRPNLLSSNRYHNPPGARYYKRAGFRCVLAPVSSILPAVTPPIRAGSNTPLTASTDQPFVNTLGMKFVPVPMVSGPTAGQQVLFSVWDTRVQDYAAYAGAKKVDDAWTKQQRDGVPAGRELNHPVVGVSWEEAQGFCQWLTEKESAEGRLPRGLKYRLPTDEEWSWAVALPPELGGTPAEKNGKNTVDFPWGKDWPPTRKVGNYADESFHQKFPKDVNDKKKDQPWLVGYDDGYAATSPVGSFPANAYGLYDMGGNVWQWCEDWSDKNQKFRVVRGAPWDFRARDYLLSSYRPNYAPETRNNNIGFRCVVDKSAR